MQIASDINCFFLKSSRKTFKKPGPIGPGKDLKERFCLLFHKEDCLLHVEEAGDHPGDGHNTEDGGKDYSLLVDGNRIVAFPARHVDALAELKQRLRVVQYGVCVGESKRNDLVPSHALALSPLLLRREAFGEAAVAYPQAIAYLRNESLVLPPEVLRGYVLLTYCDVPLGFVKNLGTRANNLYPQDWRIRSSYLPDDAPCLFG